MPPAAELRVMAAVAALVAGPLVLSLEFVVGEAAEVVILGPFVGRGFTCVEEMARPEVVVNVGSLIETPTLPQSCCVNADTSSHLVSSGMRAGTRKRTLNISLGAVFLDQWFEGVIKRLVVANARNICERAAGGTNTGDCRSLLPTRNSVRTTLAFPRDVKALPRT